MGFPVNSVEGLSVALDVEHAQEKPGRLPSLPFSLWERKADHMFRGLFRRRHSWNDSGAPRQRGFLNQARKTPWRRPVYSREPAGLEQRLVELVQEPTGHILPMLV